MKKIIAKNIVLLMSVAVFLCHHVTRVQAAPVSLSISPPVVEILLAPNKKVVQTFTLKNQGEAVKITPTLHLAKPIDSHGHVMVDPTPLNLGSIPLVATLSLHPFGEEIVLPEGGSLPLTLTLEGASVDSTVDTYLALVAAASPLDLESTVTSTTPAISGLIFVTLTPTGVMPADLEVTNFDLPLLHDTRFPLSLTPTVKNKADVMIEAGARLTVIDTKGKTVFESAIEKTLILKDSERTFAPLIWHPRWSNLGPYRVKLSLLTEGGTKLTETERVVWFLPLRDLIVITTLIGLLLFIWLRYKKARLTLLLCLALLLSPQAHVHASLTGVKDTLSTSTLSTSETPIDVQHVITFTPSILQSQGSFRLLLPGDPATGNDGLPDQDGYDFHGGVSVSIESATGYTFGVPVGYPAGSPHCTTPRGFHCFVITYTKVGSQNPALKVTIGTPSHGLIAPISALTHTPGVADIAAYIVRQYDQDGNFVEETVGNVGHVEGVQVVATVKGTPQGAPVNLITIPFLPATVTQLTTRAYLTVLLLSLLAIGIFILLFLLWKRRYNLILLDPHGDPLPTATVYHSIPDTKVNFTRVFVTHREPLRYNLEKGDHGKLYIRHLSRYSTLTVQVEETIYILSLSVKRGTYTLILG